MTTNPYLTFNGNCEEAFNFYKSVFGGDFAHLARFNEMPPEVPVPEDKKNEIMHVALPISTETVLMGSDFMENPYSNALIAGNNFSISVNVESEAEANRIFEALSAGGKIMMPLEKAFWNAYFGMFTDKFGINWMVNYSYEQK